MHIDISKLLNHSLDEILVSEKIIIDSNYFKKTEIKSLSEINVNGIIKKQADIIILELSIKGIMIVPCSISLEDVSYPFNIEIYEILDESINGEYLKIDKNSIDILPLIWQNIVLEVPIKIISPNIDRSKLSGDGWIFKEES